MVDLLRPLNGLIAAAGVAVAILVARSLAPVPGTAWLACLAAALVGGFGNVLNDLRDVAVDRTNHPGRPLPSGRITPRGANLMAGWLAATGLAAAYLGGAPGHGLALAALAAATAALLVAYELALKVRGLPGNAAVALATALTFPFGWLAATGTWPQVPGGTSDPLAWTYEPAGAILALAVMAAVATLARELAKDIEDVAGDRGHRRTLPMTHLRLAGLLALAAACLAVLASVGLAPVFFNAVAANDHGALGRGGILAAGAIVTAADALVLSGGVATATGRAGLGQRLLKLGMALAIVAVGGLAAATRA